MKSKSLYLFITFIIGMQVCSCSKSEAKLPADTVERITQGLKVVMLKTQLHLVEQGCSIEKKEALRKTVEEIENECKKQPTFERCLQLIDQFKKVQNDIENDVGALPPGFRCPPVLTEFLGLRIGLPLSQQLCCTAKPDGYLMRTKFDPTRKFLSFDDYNVIFNKADKTIVRIECTQSFIDTEDRQADDVFALATTAIEQKYNQKLIEHREGNAIIRSMIFLNDIKLKIMKVNVVKGRGVNPAIIGIFVFDEKKEKIAERDGRRMSIKEAANAL